MSLKKVKQIAAGYTNLAKSTMGTAKTDIEKLAAARMGICNNCDHLTSRNTCALCGCFMPAKTRVQTATCPAGKW
ncbi:MAG: DUF6171 family protein [Fulvivirga sp.]|mgnify:CR=1 FL=1